MGQGKRFAGLTYIRIMNRIQPVCRRHTGKRFPSANAQGLEAVYFLPQAKRYKRKARSPPKAGMRPNLGTKCQRAALEI
jgi:hypothetical protein